MYPFETVVQHHQGAGAPNDNYAFAEGGYSYGIGVNGWRLFREPSTDYSTIDFNHVVVGVCLSGNREDYVVTAQDIQFMREIAHDAKMRGWLVQSPVVKPHREMPGSNTVCPGQNAAPPYMNYPGNTQIWGQIVTAYQGLPVEDDVPLDKDFVDGLETSDGAWKLQYDGGVETIKGSFYGSYFTLPAAVRNDPTRRFLTIFANTPGYSLLSTKGEVYTFSTKQ